MEYVFCNFNVNVSYFDDLRKGCQNRNLKKKRQKGSWEGGKIRIFKTCFQVELELVPWIFASSQSFKACQKYRAFFQSWNCNIVV